MGGLVLSPELRGADFWPVMGGALSRSGKARFSFTGFEVVVEKRPGGLAAGGWGKPPVSNSLGLATKLCLCVVVGGVVVWSTEEERGGMKELIPIDELFGALLQ